MFHRPIPLPRADHTHLAFTITKAYLDYTEAKGLVTPPVPPDQGVVLSGKLPLWLYTALALIYTSCASFSFPWLAVYQPQLRDKAVVSSRNSAVGGGSFVQILVGRLRKPRPDWVNRR